MDLNFAAGEPAPAAFGQLVWFGDFRHAKYADKKLARDLLASCRHRELNVVDLEKGMFSHSPASCLSRLR
jgi:hypothetical protein